MTACGKAASHTILQLFFLGGNFFEGVLPAIVNSGFILLLSPNALVEDVSVTSPALGPIVQSQRIRRSHELGFCITWKCSCQEQVHRCCTVKLPARLYQSRCDMRLFFLGQV